MVQTEKSMKIRMLAGELYLANDAELTNLNHRAQKLFNAFNNTAPDALEERQTLLSALFGTIGPNCEIKPPFRCDYGSHIICGEQVFMNYGCTILDCNTVHIGDRTLIGPTVQIYAASHPFDPVVRRAGWELALPVKIGEDVWIGGAAIICPGVSIGNGSTIGAGSVVTKDIPAGVVAAGNSCRVIREL